MSSSSLRSFAAGAALALTACSSNPTQLLVIVDSDLAVPDPLASIRVVVRDPDGSELLSHSFSLAAPSETTVGGAALPISFGVGPPAGDASRRVILDLEANGPASTLFIRRTLTGFASGKTLVLPLYLAGHCRGQTCPEGRTCTERGCEDPTIDPSQLCEDKSDQCAGPMPPPADAGLTPPADAGLTPSADAGLTPPADAGVVDARADSGLFEDGGVGADATDSDGGPPPGDASMPDAGCSAATCPDGTCYGAECCRGCWNGVACANGDLLTACGTAGSACLNCDDGNPCTQDSCSVGACNRTNVAGTCPGGVCVGDICHCGASGEPCCASSPECEAGQSCSGTTCGSCGALGQPCCTSSIPCSGGAVCGAGSTCQRCGGEAEACCAGNTCNANLLCSATTCQCGAPGEPCCGGVACDSNLTCAGSTCQCGGLGQACCAGTTCGANLACGANGTCQCGGAGQPCCGGVGGSCTEGCCGGGGTANVCGTQTDTQFCAGHSATCGVLTANDRCNVPRSINCGGCNCPEVCSNNNCGAICRGLGGSCGCDEQCCNFPAQYCGGGTCCKDIGVSCQNNGDCCSGCCTTDTFRCVNGC